MCGILCVFGICEGADSVKCQVLERVKRIRHRGPDRSGCYEKGNHIMCHERLSIVDPLNGAQPLVSREKDLVLAMNGEIYNHKLIRASIKKDVVWQTKCDSECVLQLYKEHSGNLDWLNLLNGIFAITLYDETNDRFLIARDHAGIIPLYWGRDLHGSVWVCSELKGIHDICPTFEDFPPGHVYDSKTHSLTKWYKPAWHDEKRLPSNKLDIAALRHSLEAAVSRQLMSDVPYGVLLSGGLDSSIIAAVAAKICKQKMKNGDDEIGSTYGWFRQLHSFSIGLKGSPDLAAARIVANHIGTAHHEFVFTVEEGLNAIRDVIYHLETYDVTTIRAATPMYLMSRQIKALGIKMVLSGEGADEVFGGYLYFHKCPNPEEFQQESVRKVKGLYKFDCLRANKSTMAWGLEARVPFLDVEFLEHAMGNISAVDKMCGNFANPKGRIEKWVVRKAFEDMLPKEIVWRQKEQFSDGVGYSWIDGIKAYAGSIISDNDLANSKYRFPHNPPTTKESYFIRHTFASHFPERAAAECVPGGPSVACSTAAAIAWDEAFKKFADCSGRSVSGVHNSAYDESHRSSEGSKGSAVSDDHLKNSNLEFCTSIRRKDTLLAQEVEALMANGLTKEAAALATDQVVKEKGKMAGEEADESAPKRAKA